MSLTTFAIGLDTTVVGVALPSMHRDLPGSAVGISAVVVGYTLAFGSLMLSAGHIADVYGRRRVFLAGAMVFALASLACGMAATVPILVCARFVQGCAAAVLNSAGLAILAQTFAGSRPQTAFRIWGAIMGASFAVGPLAGGFATEYVGWRWVFLVNIPILLLCGLAVTRSVPGDNSSGSRPVDGVGQLLVVGTFAGVFGAVSATGGGPVGVLTGVGCAAACSIALMIRKPRPGQVINRDYFSNIETVAVTLVPVAFSLCFWCLLIIVPDRLGTAAGEGPVRSALTVLPLTIGLVVAAFIPTSDTRHSFRLSFTTGFAGTAIGAAIAATVHTMPGLVAGMLVMGFAAGYMNPDVARSAITLAGPERAGMAAGLTSSMRQIGFGTGVLTLGRLGDGSVSAPQALTAPFMASAAIAFAAAILLLPVRALGSHGGVHGTAR